ncbi:MAG: hypothetical protein ABS84_11935 [Rubrivivax sp. SCN 71-131]|jgi:uncharacterized protein YciI|nr:MAG: hypothetical protein ABS84_11935 [Rubrivivax sp. SCN 71-131]
MPERCLVVLHSPGPSWEPGLPLTQQLGVREHEAHYAELARQGQLLMGGPFADGAGGGLMIFKPGIEEDTLRMHALTDPAVESGLLQFEIRPWQIGFKA